MSVPSGCTNQKTRSWSGTLATSITPMASSGECLVSINSADALGANFDISMDIVQAATTAICGGMAFCIQSGTQYYNVVWNTYSSGTLYLQRDSVDCGGGTVIASAAISSIGNATVRVVKSGSLFDVYLAGTKYISAASDATYSSGKTGCAYPNGYYPNSTFSNFVLNAAATAKIPIALFNQNF